MTAIRSTCQRELHLIKEKNLENARKYAVRRGALSTSWNIIMGIFQGSPAEFLLKKMHHFYNISWKILWVRSNNVKDCSLNFTHLYWFTINIWIISFHEQREGSRVAEWSFNLDTIYYEFCFEHIPLSFPSRKPLLEETEICMKLIWLDGHFNYNLYHSLVLMSLCAWLIHYLFMQDIFYCCCFQDTGYVHTGRTGCFALFFFSFIDLSYFIIFLHFYQMQNRFKSYSWD